MAVFGADGVEEVEGVEGVDGVDGVDGVEEVEEQVVAWQYEVAVPEEGELPVH